MKYNTIAISMTQSHLLNTGLGEFENSIAIRMAKRAPQLLEQYGIKIVYIVEPQQVGAYGSNVGYYVISRRKRDLLKQHVFTPIRRWLLPHWDLLHWTNQFFKFGVRLSPLQLVTVHDINYIHNDITKWHKLKKDFVTSRRLKHATHLSFISQFTDRDVRQHFNINKPTRVIYNGVTNLNTHTQQEYDDALKDMNLPKSFLFHISRWSKKKNVILTLQMMKHLPEEHLVLAGTCSRKFEKLVNDTIQNLQLNNVTIVGHVSTEQKAALLSRCKALVFASLSEGFGLPVVEAMCFGKPSFITRLTSLPEIGGDISYYFTSLDPQQMAETVRHGLADFAANPTAKAQALKDRAAQFNWDKAVDEYVDYYLDILNIKHK